MQTLSQKCITKHQIVTKNKEEEINNFYIAVSIYLYLV